MISNKSSHFPKLSKRQLSTLPHILSSPTYEEAARRANISSKQIYEWLKDPVFKSELEKQRNRIVQNAIDILRMNTIKAAEVLAELLSSSNETVKRRAVNDILNQVGKYIELQELESRIAILEEQIKRTS